MNYTQAQIDRANAASLEDFLRTQGETLSLEVLLVRRNVRPHVISQPIHRTDRTEQRVLRRLKVLDGTIFVGAVWVKVNDALAHDRCLSFLFQICFGGKVVQQQPFSLPVSRRPFRLGVLLQEHSKTSKNVQKFRTPKSNYHF